jgi:hypothetical protein
MEQHELQRAAELVSGLESKIADLESQLKKVNIALERANELADAVLDKLRRAEEKDFD